MKALTAEVTGAALPRRRLLPVVSLDHFDGDEEATNSKADSFLTMWNMKHSARQFLNRRGCVRNTRLLLAGRQSKSIGEIDRPRLYLCLAEQVRRFLKLGTMFNVDGCDTEKYKVRNRMSEKRKILPWLPHSLPLSVLEETEETHLRGAETLNSDLGEPLTWNKMPLASE